MVEEPGTQGALSPHTDHSTSYAHARTRRRSFSLQHPRTGAGCHPQAEALPPLAPPTERGRRRGRRKAHPGPIPHCPPNWNGKWRTAQGSGTWRANCRTPVDEDIDRHLARLVWPWGGRVGSVSLGRDRDGFVQVYLVRVLYALAAIINLPSRSITVIQPSGTGRLGPSTRRTTAPSSFEGLASSQHRSTAPCPVPVSGACEDWLA